MAEIAILFDSSRCSACKGCQVSCKQWNNLPSPTVKDSQSFTGSYQSPVDLNGDTRLIITFDETAGGTNGVEWAFGRRGCFHCTEPACVEICPSGAMSKNENGVVSLDSSKCIGCQYCASACPFSVPKYREAQKHIDKCSMCIDRIEQGREPACVQTCQPGALSFGLRDDMIALGKERVEYLKNKGFDRAELYGETQMGGLHVMTVAKYGIDALGLPADPKTSSLVAFTQLMKPLTGIGVGAVIAGLGISLIASHGYHRDEVTLAGKSADNNTETKAGTSKEER